MERKNILVLFGGGGTEHEVSRISSSYLVKQLAKTPNFNPITVEITKEGHWESEGRKCSLNGRILKTPTEQPFIDYVIPCIHGKPGETGEIQSFLEIQQLPYFGCKTRASVVCFDKVITKLWLEKLGIPTTPWLFSNIQAPLEISKIEGFFDNNESDIFIKAAEQGSSVGCFHVTEKKEIQKIMTEAFKFSDNVLVEKTIKARELEVAVFESNGSIIATPPGEIICPSKFYNFDEKYNDNSDTTTNVVAKDITQKQLAKINEYSLKAFKAIGLRHLSRIDYFLTSTGSIYLNEINTFPGMTPISMFPMMLEETGLNYNKYIKENIERDLR